MVVPVAEQYQGQTVLSDMVFGKFYAAQEMLPKRRVACGRFHILCKERKLMLQN